MDSLEIKTIKWKNSFKIPNTPWNIKGYSRSAYRTGFYIPELDIMLDAGCQNFNKPNHIFITHTHLDHIAELPFTLIGNPEGNHIFNIYAPADAKAYIDDYIRSAFQLNSLEIINPFEWYKINMCKQNDQYIITANNSILQIDLFACNHRIPTVGYGFSTIKDKLKKEYLGLSGKEIVNLKKQNIPITQKVVEPKFIYLCDTDIDVFKINNLKTILSYPTIFIECTFILPDEIENAKSTMHIHWQHLRPYVINSDNTFILFHFSQRYSDAEIHEFFENEKKLNSIDNLYIIT